MLIRKYQKKLIFGFSLLSASLFVNNTFAIPVSGVKSNSKPQDIDSLLGGLDLSNSSLLSDSVRPISGLYSYEGRVNQLVRIKVGNSFDIYKNKRCFLTVFISRDGNITGIIKKGGDIDLCNKAVEVVSNIKKLPAPPTDETYEYFSKTGIEMSFKP